MAERFPTPLLNMSPAGLPGLATALVFAIGMWSLLGSYFLMGLGIAVVVAVGGALAVQRWRTRHPSDHSVLHLDSDPIKREGNDV